MDEETKTEIEDAVSKQKEELALEELLSDLKRHPIVQPAEYFSNNQAAFYQFTPLYSKESRVYALEREQGMNDFTKFADKTLHIMPAGYMGGVLGFTYLGENFMARQEGLRDDLAREVDVHEAVHTPDEYETRVIVDWILSREPPKYRR
jgi:hypothetical protein